SLDVFGVHGIGGIIGAVLTGVFIREGYEGAVDNQWIQQIKSVVVTVVWSAVAATIALTVAKVAVGLRVEESDEDQGLDTTSHGETGYSAG
ncbi:MAG: ammonia channel protein, partial [Verrucomicrobiales bacterium]